MNLRIGFITGEYPPMQGGIADYSAILGNELAQLGHEVYVLTDPAASPSRHDIHVTPTIASWNRAFFGAIERWAMQHDLHLVNLQYQTAAFNMAGLLHFLPSRVNRPFVTTFHDLRFPYLFPKAGRLRPWIVNELARRSDGIIVTNRGDETELHQEASLPPIIRIPLGPTIDIYYPDAERVAHIRRGVLGDDTNAFIVGHFGFINASKGVDTLLQAIGIARQQGLPVKLLMIGERIGASDSTNYAYAKMIDGMAAELGIEPLWTGFVPDERLGEFLLAPDAIALPFKDGASLRRTSIQATLAYGCPLITTEPSDDPLPEFRDGVHVLYTQRDNPHSLAQAFLRLRNDPKLPRWLSVNAQNAAQEFSWPQIAKDMVDFYQRILG